MRRFFVGICPSGLNVAHIGQQSFSNRLNTGVLHAYYLLPRDIHDDILEVIENQLFHDA